MATHVALHTIGCCGSLLLAKECREGRELLVDKCWENSYLTLEAWQTLIEWSFSTTTSQAKTSLEAPLVLVICYLKRWENRYRSLALIKLTAISFVTTIERKRILVRGVSKSRYAESRCYLTCLIYVLEIEREVKTLVEEGYTSRIKIDTIDTNCTDTCKVTVESDVLIGVCEQSSGLCWCCHCKQ